MCELSMCEWCCSRGNRGDLGKGGKGKNTRDGQHPVTEERQPSSKKD